MIVWWARTKSKDSARLSDMRRTIGSDFMDDNVAGGAGDDCGVWVLWGGEDV